MRVLALDPATLTGWVEAELIRPGHGRVLGHGCWDLGAGWDRPRVLRGHLRSRLRRGPPVQALALERHMDHGVTVRGKDGQARRVQAIDAAHLSGALLFAIHEVALDHQLPVAEVTPTAVKASAGGGRFKKAEMVGAARRRFGLALSEDEADALFVFTSAFHVLTLEVPDHVQEAAQK